MPDTPREDGWPGREATHVLTMDPDDASVKDDEELYRRIARYGDTSMMVIDEASGATRASSGAFKLDSDGCSVYRRSILEAHDLAVEALVRDPLNVVVSITALEVRDVHLGVRADPWPPHSDGHARDVAHALLVNPDELGKNPLRRALQTLALGSVICIAPVCGPVSLVWPHCDGLIWPHLRHAGGPVMTV